METLTKQIELILENNKGSIFTISDFYSLGSKNTIKSVLYRLCDENKIVRLMDGMYTKPKYNQIIDEFVLPSIDYMAKNWLVNISELFILAL